MKELWVLIAWKNQRLTPWNPNPKELGTRSQPVGTNNKNPKAWGKVPTKTTPKGKKEVPKP